MDFSAQKSTRCEHDARGVDLNSHFGDDCGGLAVVNEDVVNRLLEDV